MLGGLASAWGAVGGLGDASEGGLGGFYSDLLIFGDVFLCFSAMLFMRFAVSSGFLIVCLAILQGLWLYSFPLIFCKYLDQALGRPLDSIG